MAYRLLAGAPFDAGNLFLVPAIDPGLIVNPYPDAIVTRIDGGVFTDGAGVLADGGLIPLEGTATYDPTKEYGPDDVIVIPGFNDAEPTI
jgi:hypothetical protein